VVEALRVGQPLVTTPIGAQGLPGLDQVASVCDDAQAFADAVCRLLEDDALWRARCTAQIAYASARYGEATFRASLLRTAGITSSRISGPSRSELFVTAGADRPDPAILPSVVHQRWRGHALRDSHTSRTEKNPLSPPFGGGEECSSRNDDAPLDRSQL